MEEATERLRDRVIGAIKYNIGFGLTQRAQPLYGSVIDALTQLTWRILLRQHANDSDFPEQVLIRRASSIACDVVDSYCDLMEKHAL